MAANRYVIKYVLPESTKARSQTDVRQSRNYISTRLSRSKCMSMALCLSVIAHLNIGLVLIGFCLLFKALKILNFAFHRVNTPSEIDCILRPTTPNIAYSMVHNVTSRAGDSNCIPLATYRESCYSCIFVIDITTLRERTVNK